MSLLRAQNRKPDPRAAQFTPESRRARAERFSREAFQKKFMAFVDAEIARFGRASPNVGALKTAAAA